MLTLFNELLPTSSSWMLENIALSLFTDGSSIEPSVLNSVLLSGTSSSVVWPIMCTEGACFCLELTDTPESLDWRRDDD